MSDATLRVTGDLTIANANASTYWLDKLPLTNPHIIVDLTAVGLIDSSAVATLVRLHRRAQVNNCTLTVHNLPERLGRLLNFYGLTDIIQVAYIDN